MSDLTERIALLMEEEGYSVEDTFLIDEMLLKTREVSRAKPLRRSPPIGWGEGLAADPQNQ